ncbi:MAG: hypothetical protein ACP5FK_01610 [bacterium]
MKKYLFIILIAVLLFGCSNQAQVEELNVKIAQYETKINELESEINQLKEQLAVYDTIEINDMTLNEIKNHLELINEENVKLKLLNDSLIDEIYKLENPGSEGSVSHPTVPIQQIK